MELNITAQNHIEISAPNFIENDKKSENYG
jgi:hypothetical protein